jgi:antitoxin ParD1/3/4
MPTRNVVLTDRQDELVAELIASGRYKSASEVLRAALRLLEDRVERQQAELEDIRAGVIEGLKQAERGEFVDGSMEEVVAGAFARARASRNL